MTDAITKEFTATRSVDNISFWNDSADCEIKTGPVAYAINGVAVDRETYYREMNEARDLFEERNQ